jgi:hypothetical protein
MFWNGSTARRFVGQRQHGFKLGLFPSGHAVDAHRPGRRALAWAEAPFGRRSTENLKTAAMQVWEQLKATPEHFAEVERDLQLDLISFKSRRERPKN